MWSIGVAAARSLALIDLVRSSGGGWRRTRDFCSTFKYDVCPHNFSFPLSYRFYKKASFYDNSAYGDGGGINNVGGDLK